MRPKTWLKLLALSHKNPIQVQTNLSFHSQLSNSKLELSFFVYNTHLLAYFGLTWKIKWHFWRHSQKEISQLLFEIAKASRQSFMKSGRVSQLTKQLERLDTVALNSWKTELFASNGSSSKTRHLKNPTWARMDCSLESLCSTSSRSEPGFEPATASTISESDVQHFNVDISDSGSIQNSDKTNLLNWKISRSRIQPP